MRCCADSKKADASLFSGNDEAWPRERVVEAFRESMVLLKAFLNGRFFPAEYLQELNEWKFIAFPVNFYFGIGLEKFWIPRIYSPFKPIGEILGFWGQSGVFAFHNPQPNLYFTGTVNQLSGWGRNSQKV